MSKSSFEIRLDLLNLSYRMLSEVIPTKEYKANKPTAEDVIETANKLNAFVSQPLVKKK